MIILIIGIDFQTFAQQQTTLDSLINLLSILPNDTQKVNTYYAVSRLYNRELAQPDVARKYVDSIRWLSEELNYEKGRDLSVYYNAEINKDEGNYDEALQQYQQYIENTAQRGDSLEMAKGLVGVAAIYIYTGDRDKSLPFLFRALRIYETQNYQKGLASVLNNIGVVYKGMGKSRDAIDVYLQASEKYQSEGMEKEYAMSLQNLAIMYRAVESYDTALIYYDQSLSLIKKLDYKRETAMVLGNLGSLYDVMDQYDKALAYHLQALAILKELPNKRSLTYCLHNIGYSNLKLNNYAESEKYLNEALEVAQELKAKVLIYVVYETMADLFASQKDFEKGYHYYTLFHQMSDSIYNEESVQQVNELQAKYETEKKDKQIALLAKEKEIQEKEAQRQATLKRAFVGGLIAVILLAGLVVLILRQRMKNQKLLAAKNEEIKEVNFKQQLSELEIKALRAQINPHFLFNCMNSINRMILNGESEDASRYLTKFSKLVRLILENSETTTVSLENELSMLESYIQLEALRFKGKINYQIVLDEDIDPEDTYLPSMVLQPFVENAIWHGLMHKDGFEQGMITIAIREEEDRLLCTIEDNGIGREKARILSEKTVLKSKSLGMKITEERLRLLSKKQLEKLINITDLKDSMNRALGTRVDIMVPIS